MSRAAIAKREHSPPVDALPQELALPGMHDTVLALIRSETADPGASVLDAGAGEGSLSAKLAAAGYRVCACDLFPEMFRATGIECCKADASGALPYDDEQFDLVASVEVVEHLDGHRTFFEESHRVLKPGGALIITTPNMQSLKSRLRFLLTGYYYSFGPLEPGETDPVRQHISPFTIDRYRFLLGRCGFRLDRVATEKYQKSSLTLAGLAPAVWLLARLKFGGGRGVKLQNSAAALFGRTLFMVARKVERT